MLSGQCRFLDLKVTQKAIYAQELMLPSSRNRTVPTFIRSKKLKQETGDEKRLLWMQACTYISKSLSTSRGEMRLEANIRGGGWLSRTLHLSSGFVLMPITYQYFSPSASRITPTWTKI